jgi:broad specificity phosphatase PhoE
LWQRYRAGLEHILEGKSGRNLILVAHGTILSLTLPDLFPAQDVSAWLDQPSHNCSIGEALLAYTDGRLQGRLLGWGYCEHLSGEAARFVSGLPGPGDFDGGPEES